jgi:DNA-binding LacI/PurR family transcriptional regulator
VTSGREVLLIGFDPNAVPGVDARLVELAIAMGEQQLRDAGYDTTYCLVAPEDPDLELQIVDALTRRRYGCVVVGGGIRKPPELLELFERVVNLVRVHAPDAAIAFNATGADSADAVRRVLAIGEDGAHAP